MLFLSSLLRCVFPNTLGLLLIAASVLTIEAPVSAMTIEGWKYDPEKGQVELEIADGVKPRHFLMAQPARIVVDLQDTQMGSAPAQMTYTSGPIQRITVEQLQPQLTRVTLYMFPSVVFAKGQVAIDRLGDGNRGTSDVWALRPLLKGMALSNSPDPAAPLQIKTETQTLTQTPTPIKAITPVQAVTSIQSPVSQTIPIAVPAASPETSIASRISAIRPATPPQLEDMPPGMAAAIQPSGKSTKDKPSSVTAKPVLPTQPVLPTKIETVKPEATKPEAPKTEAPKFDAVKPEAPKPLETKPEAAKPNAPETPKLEAVQVIKPEAPKFEAPQQIATAPSPEATAFPPTIAPPISVSIPIAVPAPQSTPIVAKAEDIVLPESLPVLTPTQPLQPGTVSVPPLSTIPAVPAQPMTPVGSPTSQPMQVPAKNSPFSFPLPDRLPQQPTSQPLQRSTQQPTQQSPTSSFPLPDRVPTAIPNQSTPQSPRQSTIFPMPGADRNALASNPSTVKPNVISFGQPLVTSLPPSSATQTPSSLSNPPSSSPANAIVLRSSSDGRVGLPTGTVLTVRYTGISPIVVKGESRKEILTLQSAIRDQNGMVLAPEGTTIYGSFVGKENRFVAESIVLQGQTIALTAQSDNLGGSRNPSERSLLQNSGIGVLAGVLIGGLSGGNAIGGAAAGAVVSYATAPKSATIQPGQTLELKLTQDWIIPFVSSVSRSVGG